MGQWIDERARRELVARRALVTLALGLAVGCTSTVDATSDLGLDDVAMDDGARERVTCAADRDCDDGLFCNGAEQCHPSEPSADSHGCLGGRVPCMAMQTCSEATDRCVSNCDRMPDADRDGHDARECGGDDCDDGDPNRFPGAGREVCDPMQRDHDEDCDATTYANPMTRDGDRDGDMSVDARCCNTDRNGNRECGPDCNDMDRNVRPSQVEGCNGRDDNCNGVIDEGLTSREYCRDADGDMFGNRAGARMTTCAPTAGYAADCTDCDDGNPRRNPGAPEVCDGVDNNCNGQVDEGLARTDCCADSDGDGAADMGRRMSTCGVCPGGWRQCGAPWDCCDRDANAFPGQTRYFGRPHACGGFDYNCNGREDHGCPAPELCDCSRCGGQPMPWDGIACGTLYRGIFCGGLNRCVDQRPFTIPAQNLSMCQ